METPWAQEIYKKRSETAEWPFGNIKQNLKVTEFNTTGFFIAFIHQLYQQVSPNEFFLF